MAELAPHRSHASGTSSLDGDGKFSAKHNELQSALAAEAEIVKKPKERIYAEKAELLNQAVVDIGHGRYQWALFVVIGLGYAAENWQLSLTSLIYTSVIREFQPSQGPLLQLGQALGLLLGAAFWSPASDVIGRRPALIWTFAFIGVFTLAAGASPNFASVIIFCFLWSFGVGGSLPCSTSAYLEWLPPSKAYLLTVLSVWFYAAQVVVNGVAWAVMGQNSCTAAESAAGQCDKSNNSGWRYLCYISGGLWLLLWALRFLFLLRESPKWLMSRGSEAEAVETVKWLADYNKKLTNISLEDFHAIDARYGGNKALEADTPSPATEKKRLSKLNFANLRALFKTRRQGSITSLLCWTWFAIGLAFPLYYQFIPFFLATRFAEEPSMSRVYRDLLITAVVALPACLLGGWLVTLKSLGRTRTLAISTVLTGLFVGLSLTARDLDILLGWNILFSFTAAIMYAVLFALTPEIFATKIRGTGVGLAASFNRIGGLIGPVIAMEADLTTSAPVIVAAVIFAAGGISAIFLPEARGKPSL